MWCLTFQKYGEQREIYLLNSKNETGKTQSHLVMWGHPSHSCRVVKTLQAAIYQHQRLCSTCYSLWSLAKRPQEFQLYTCSVYASTTEVNTAVVSAFDLCAEMVSITFPKENLKYQRLKQQEEAAKQRRLLTLVTTKKESNWNRSRQLICYSDSLLSSERLILVVIRDSQEGIIWNIKSLCGPCLGIN